MEVRQHIKKLSKNAEDLTGNQYGDWTVDSFSHVEKTARSRNYMWNVTCVCGKKSVVSASNLKVKSKGPKGCGCKVKRYTDLTGKTFSEWIVQDLDRIDRYPNYNTGNDQTTVFWNCKCSCGVERSVAAYNLTRGKSKSCGCRGKRRQSTDDFKNTSAEAS